MNTIVNIETTPDRDLIGTFYPALFQYLQLDPTLEPVQQSTRLVALSLYLYIYYLYYYPALFQYLQLDLTVYQVSYTINLFIHLLSIFLLHI